MLNRLMRVTTSEYSTILYNAKKPRTFIAEINGKDIETMDDYLSATWKAFSFPQTGHINYYAYLDWIRDLDWLGADAYIFAILNFKTFMDKLPEERDIIINSLENTVIPWWDFEIVNYQVGGKAKAFNVYLVD